MRWQWAGAAGAAMIAGAAIAAPANGPTFVALAKVERGLWQLREVEGPTRRLCVADPSALFQLQGREAGCSRFVIENSARSATVTYSCPSGGHGRTSIVVETPRLMRIDTQGVDGGVPFAIEAEARRMGAC
jgi:hypothetical protein